MEREIELAKATRALADALRRVDEIYRYHFGEPIILPPKARQKPRLEPKEEK
jgi:hypothetical protein